VRFVPRDIQILYALGLLGPTLAEIIGRLLFPTTSEAEEERRATTRARLSKLAEAGFVSILRPNGVTSPNLYALTARGRELVVSETDADPARLRVMTKLGRTNIVHHSMIVSLRVSLVLACRLQPETVLQAFHSERELRGRAQASSSPVVPDALVILARASRRLAWAIEADTGTERHSVWKRKLTAYRERRAQGTFFDEPDWGLAILVPTERRARSIFRAIESENAGGFAVVGVEAALQEQGPLSSVWRTHGGGAIGLGHAPSAITPASTS
jgi:hypothetical protein